MAGALSLVLAAALPAAVSAGSGSAPVLVELFTSQGCSSCPPADKLLASWGAEAFKRGEIVPLAYHVDYWDYIGWKDPFDSPEFSRRQAEYGRALGVRSYTPEMIVAGREAFVGSEEREAKSEVAFFSKRAAPAEIQIRLPRSSGRRWNLSIEVRPTDAAKGPYSVMLALFQNGLSTDVKAGENAGQTLRDEFVVRDLRDLGSFDPASGKPFKRDLELPKDPSARDSDWGAAVFLQEPKSLEVPAARALFPLTPSGR